MRIWVSVAGSLPLLAACAGQDVTRTGFLSSYDDMRPTADHTEDLIYVVPGFAAADYTKVVIEPVAWKPAPDTPARDPEVVAHLKGAFHDDLVKVFSKRFAVVEPAMPGADPGPGVLRVRAAITNTRKANWYINGPVQVTGIAFAAAGIPAPLPPPNPGGASEEMEVTDAQTGKRLVAVATYNNGMPWNMLGYYQQFGHARRAFSLAADQLFEQVDKRQVASKYP